MSLKIPATHWLHAISFESLGIESGDLVFVLAFQSLPLQLERRRDQVVLGNPRFRFHEYFAGNFELLNVGWKKKHRCYNRALTQHQVLNFQNCLIILKLRCTDLSWRYPARTWREEFPLPCSRTTFPSRPSRFCRELVSRSSRSERWKPSRKVASW